MTSVRDGLRYVERPFKKAVVSILRLLLGSRPVRLVPGSSFHRIVVIRQHNQLGDMLCVVPLLRTIRSACPDATVVLLASPVNARIMEKNRYLDEVMLYDKTDFLSGGRIHLLDFWRYVRALRRRNFDLAVVPATVSTSSTSDLLAYLSGARVRVGIRSLDGRENPSWFLYNVTQDLDWRNDPGRHQTLRNADILTGFWPPPENLACEVTLSREEQEDGAKWLAERQEGSKLAVAFHPGAGKLPNRWPADRFAAVARTLADEYDLEPYVSAGPIDKIQVEEMLSTYGKGMQIIDVQSIRETASILYAMDLVVSNDTGIMHVAAAVGVPVVSLFGPTDPRHWAPTGSFNRYIRGEGGDIRTIGVHEVLSVCRELLDDRITRGTTRRRHPGGTNSG